jgi:hypothetical protein
MPGLNRLQPPTVNRIAWNPAMGFRNQRRLYENLTDIKNLRRDFPEVTWHTFEQWAREQDWTVLDQN